MFSIERRLVDNRVFLLGLDKLYRDAMKRHERGELLACARRVTIALEIQPAQVPIEGYYAEDQRLTEYFLLLRALQQEPEDRASAVAPLHEFQRLREVTSAPLYGRAMPNGKLLPSACDALSQALLDTRPEWTVERLIAAASAATRETDDISLVGLAARVGDAVVLTAARESVVLYAATADTCSRIKPRLWYVWKVDKDLAELARRFIAIFNALFGEELPSPEPAQAECYWRACNENWILGRCVRLGHTDTLPQRHYHWAICRGADVEFAVQDFWHSEVWTTERYRSTLRRGRGGPDQRA